MSVDICRIVLAIFMVLEVENKTHTKKKICMLTGTMSYVLDMYLFSTHWKKELYLAKSIVDGLVGLKRYLVPEKLTEEIWMGGYGCKFCSILRCSGPWPSGNFLSASEKKLQYHCYFHLSSSIMSKMFVSNLKQKAYLLQKGKSSQLFLYLMKF